MLGRYIAGTLLILGVAMMVAPESPEKPKETDIAVARTETSPAALATARPEAMAAAVKSVEAEAAEEVVAASVSSKNIQTGVEAALVQALALDATEDAAVAHMEAAKDAEAVEERIAVTLAAAVPVKASAPNLAEREARFLFVTGTKVNVRAGPSTQYRVVGAVVQGDSVELVSYEGNGWARIKIENGEKTGFMSRKFLAGEPAGG